MILVTLAVAYVLTASPFFTAILAHPEAVLSRDASYFTAILTPPEAVFQIEIFNLAKSIRDMI